MGCLSVPGSIFMEVVLNELLSIANGGALSNLSC